MRRTLLASLLLGCAPPALPPVADLPPNAFAFGVFGDGPYNDSEVGPYEQMIRDVNNAAVTLFFHVGDLIGVPCTDSHLTQRRVTLGAIQSAVLYTPGDNEWTDCLRRDSGRFPPLGRLEYLRRTYFATPRQSLGARPLPVETQSDSKEWSEFVENSRVRLGGFLFNTIHVVGSGNGSLRARGADSALQIAEVARRNAAALHWVDSAFAIAREESLRGVVFALHADPGFNDSTLAWPAHVELIKRLAEQSSTFSGQVLFIHGDSHVYRVDQPLVNPDTKTRVANFTRLETYGSPRIGWVRVVIDSVAGRVVSYEPRLMAKRFW